MPAVNDPTRAIGSSARSAGFQRARKKTPLTANVRAIKANVRML
jgi:hypothetical protein